MKITWMRCNSYEEARNHTRIIYLHEWDGKPFYWGKVVNSYFGGSKRKRDGVQISPRYGLSYRHWIEGCLQHGGALYIGKLDEEGKGRIGEVENYLIRTYGHKMNREVKAPLSPLQIEHEGDVPQSVSKRG